MTSVPKPCIRLFATERVSEYPQASAVSRLLLSCFCAILSFMYLLYLDDSGNPDNPDDSFFVLGGCAVFERSTYFLNDALESVQRSHFPSEPPVSFHASCIRAGKGFWREVSRDTRRKVLGDIATSILNVEDPGVVLFATAIRKDASCHGEDVVRLATEDLCKRFDIFLMRRDNEAGDKQRGLIVFSEGKYDQRSKVWVREFRDMGTRWGFIRTLSDIPYFASMTETRLLQAADYIAHSVFLLYEKRDASLISPIIHRFCTKDGILHGLAHLGPGRGSQCDCPACMSRRVPGNFGPWA